MLFDPTVTLGNLLAALALLVSLCTTVFAWFASRRSNVEARFQRVDERFKEGSDRMDRQEGRIARVEQRGLREVVRELGRVGLRAISPEVRERLRDARMQTHPTRRR